MEGAPRTGVAFACRTVPDRDRARVVPAGEIDVATAGEVEERLRELQEAGFACVVLDLRDVTFMDLSGLRLIQRARARAEEQGSRLELAHVMPDVMRLFEIAGADPR
jgi:anti-sigma B factor antagonist